MSNIRGKIGIIRKGMIKGWIKDEYSDEPLYLNLYINGILQSTCLSNLTRKRLEDSKGILKTLNKNFGFEFNLDSCLLKENDLICVKVQETDYELEGSNVIYTCKTSIKPQFIIFGDSHCQYFQTNEKLVYYQKWIDDYDFKTFVMNGASLLGLGKRKSRLNVTKAIRENICPYAKNIFAYGQVDIELGYYYRKIVKGENIDAESFVETLANYYDDFLKTLDLPSRQIVIKGINLTVLKESSFAIEYIKRIITENINGQKEREFYKRILQENLEPFEFRNKIGIEFNAKLEGIAEKNGYSYFDMNDYLCDNIGVGVKGDFCPAFFDHHVVDSLEMRVAHLAKLVKI